MSKADPKHGRWILPLVVAGLIGFTYVFVNALPAGTVPGGTSTTIAGSTTTTAGTSSSTTTTTLAPEITAFLAETDNIQETGNTLLDQARSTNEAWDAGDAGFGATRDGLTAVRDDSLTLVSDLTEITPPDAATDTWPAVTDAADAMAEAAAGMLDGLVNDPGPEGRQASLVEFETAVNELRAALSAVRTSVGG